jgi:hypothetical protein
MSSLSSESQETVVRLIREAVVAGFDTPEEILEHAIDAGTDEGGSLEEVTASATWTLDACIKAQLQAQEYWPRVTEFDRLAAAFKALDESGIVALHNFSCCNNCGRRAMLEHIERLRATGLAVRGYAFYHSQDTQRAVQGKGVYLCHGSTDDQTGSIGHEIAERLRSHGLSVAWDRNINHKILVTLNWKRRWPHPHHGFEQA